MRFPKRLRIHSINAAAQTYVLWKCCMGAKRANKAPSDKLQQDEKWMKPWRVLPKQLSSPVTQEKQATLKALKRIN